MRSHVWWASVRALTALGTGSALLVWGWQAVVPFVLVVAVVWSSLEWLISLGRPPARTLARHGFEAGALLAAVGGLLAEMGVLGLVVLAGLVAGAPAGSWSAGRRLLRHSAAAPERPATPSAHSPRLSDLDDEQLCRRWQHTFVDLQRTRDAGARAHVVEERQRCLDELASRHPDALSRWLGSGPLPAGSPLRYLR